MRNWSSPSTDSFTSACDTAASVKSSSNRRMNGPIDVLALLSLALPSRSALRPSKSRRLTSLPSVAPTILPAALTTITTSGSGLFQVELGWMPISAPWPTAAIGGALVKISASGPMPTSRYCDHMPFATSASFSAAAVGEPGTTVVRSWPIALPSSRRIASAAPGLPRARSSITRSSRLSTKVTPAALIACRSLGASRMRLLRVAAGELAVQGDGLDRPIAGACGDRLAQGLEVERIDQLAHRRELPRDIDKLVVANGDDARPRLRHPGAADQQCVFGILRQAVGKIGFLDRHGVPSSRARAVIAAAGALEKSAR